MFWGYHTLVPAIKSIFTDGMGPFNARTISGQNIGETPIGGKDLIDSIWKNGVRAVFTCLELFSTANY